MRGRKKDERKKTRACQHSQELAKDEIKSHDGLEGSLGRGGNCVKGWVQKGCAVCTERNATAAKEKRSETQRHPDRVGVNGVRREEEELAIFKDGSKRVGE